METLTENFKDANSEIAQTDNKLSVLKNQIKDLIEDANAQKIAVNEVVQEDLIGAYNTIVENEKR